jgi:type IV secretory pathway component VirB8
MLKKRAQAPGGLIPERLHQELVKSRYAASTAALRADRNKWFYVTVAISLVTLFCAMGWFKAEKRFAENVRVAWVKLSPNGTSEVQYTDEEKPVQYFEATVESKLIEFAEKRFSKRKETISSDFGFAKLMMSPQMQMDFMTAFKAPNVAAEHLKCEGCDQLEVKVREIQAIDKDLAPNSKRRQQYTSLVFATEIKRNKDGMTVGCANKIYTLLWIFRPTEEIVSKRDELRYNPLGQEIIRADARDDPTPATAAGCQK